MRDAICRRTLNGRAIRKANMDLGTLGADDVAEDLANTRRVGEDAAGDRNL